jgi:hypothetical protein
MSGSPHPPPNSRPRPHKEYEDPHYHDEEQDIQQDDARHTTNELPAKRHPSRKRPPLPRRRYED